MFTFIWNDFDMNIYLYFLGSHKRDSSGFCSRFGYCALYKQEKTLVSITSTVRSVCIAFLAIFSAFEWSLFAFLSYEFTACYCHRSREFLFSSSTEETKNVPLHTKAPSVSVPKVVLSFMLVLPLAFSACEGFDSCCLFISFADCFFSHGLSVCYLVDTCVH